MQAPDLEVAAPLVFRQLCIHVIVTRRGRPDLDHQGQRSVVPFEHVLALTEALAERRIAGAALDVFMEEPLPAGSPLRKLDNVILSPHAGWTTHESYGPWIAMTIENAIAYLHGDPIRVHNPAVLGGGPHDDPHAGLPSQGGQALARPPRGGEAGAS